ncbi:hypothetical protein NQ315_015375 [Exocentrus adspersus]|uniref:Uncharacterized protein n=1 Tax=Exocentrus adspersus TaxID=1586481 RepID=A0AAV8VKF5_9CUCU|nr:hypothetical protein NQ315_015375 [Exocentrus adspersus]
MTMEITEEKKRGIVRVINTLQNKENCPIKIFAKMIGTLISACPAIPYGVFHTKKFERNKYLALMASDGNYKSKMTLPSSLQPEYTWWLRNIVNAKRPLKQGKYLMEIFSDASPTGWGAVYNSEHTHGFWSQAEQNKHINYLEILAAYYALKSFVKNVTNCSILLRIDNTTAVSYINRMGGIKYKHLNH